MKTDFDLVLLMVVSVSMRKWIKFELSFFVFRGALTGGGLFTVEEYKMASILNQQTHDVWFQKLNGFQDKRCFLESSLQFSSFN